MVNLRRFLGLFSILLLFITAACGLSTSSEKGTETTSSTDLETHEKKGGHLLERHVGKTDKELIQRLNQSKISGASTFTDRATAQQVVDAVLNDPDNQKKIQQWLTSNNGKNLALSYKGDKVIGRGVFKDSRQRVYNLTHALIILKKDGAADYYILTGYPTR